MTYLFKHTKNNKDIINRLNNVINMSLTLYEVILQY